MPNPVKLRRTVPTWNKAARNFAAVLNVAPPFNITPAQYLSAPSNNGLQTGGKSFSVAFWFKGTGVNQQPLGKTTFAGDGEFAFQINGSGQMIFATVGAGGTAQIATSGVVNNGAYHFAVGVQDTGSNNRVGLSIDNGAFTFVTIAHASISNNEPVNIGASSAVTPTNFFAGDIAAVGFWQGHVLTAGEITTLYNGGHGLPFGQLGTVTRPTSYYNFDSAARPNGLLTDLAGSNILANRNGVTSIPGP